MLQKGAIAGKMMGSQWFAYSKYRGDWQNLSVCKNLVDPIQFVRIRPFCVRIHQENLLPPPFLLLTQQQQRTLGRKTSSKEKPSERSGTWGNIATCVTPTPGSGRLCCHVDMIVTMDWCLVTCCDHGHWPVERDTQWSHDPLSSDQLPWGDLCLCRSWPHNGPLSLYRGLNWPQASATCHRQHHVKQNPLMPRTKNY